MPKIIAVTINIICGKYTTVNAQTGSAWTSETRDKIISLGYDTNRVYVRDTSITQASDIQGKLQYQLATPQVISIPKGFMNVVDLGSLSLNKTAENKQNYAFSYHNIFLCKEFLQDLLRTI